MLVLLSGFVGAVIGAITTQIFNFWKFNRDERNSRIDELCGLLTSAANEAAIYWSREFTESEEVDQRIQEAKLMSLQTMMDGTFADLRMVISKDDSRCIAELFVELYDALTGGKFTEWPRERDPERLRQASFTSTSIVLELRRAHRRTIPLSGLMRAYNANKHRELDMPVRKTTQRQSENAS